jgi:hypothetical protein
MRSEPIRRLLERGLARDKARNGIKLTDVTYPEDEPKMTNRAGVAERAFQLAPSSRTLDELRDKLSNESYENINGHFSSAVLRRSLTKLLARE